jgi:hypothetical protein
MMQRMGIPRTTAKKIPAPDITVTSEFFDSAGQEYYLSAPRLPDFSHSANIKEIRFFKKKWRAPAKELSTLKPKT